jgi:microsomal prostaglandin-E synthase 2
VILLKIEHKGSPYENFPLSFRLYQYASCPYCAQIRTYLDYFGFSYHVTEVDSYSKEELTKFTRARQLPILVIEDKLSTERHKQRFHLTNATAILSALESVRNDKHINFNKILTQYLPILKENKLFSTSNPFKYHVSNSELNSVEWRRWVNNDATPAFRLNSVSNLKDLFETFDFYSKKSHWRSRYGPLKYFYVYYSNALQTYQSAPALLEQL